MIKLVASDMDGTLLNENGEVSDITKDSILKIQEKGVHFIICTGRDYEMSLSPIAKAGIRCDFICGSGAIFHPHNGDTKYMESIIDVELVKKINSILKKHSMVSELMTTHGRKSLITKDEGIDYYKNYWSKVFRESDIIADKSKVKEFSDHMLQVLDFNTDLDEFYKQQNSGVYKITTISGDYELLERAKTELNNLGCVSVESSFSFNIEITLKGVQKGPAVLRYAESKGISKDEVMVLGDSTNDLSMMEMDFGYSFAMENASEDVLNAAKYKTDTNVNHGVAKAINKYVLAN